MDLSEFITKTLVSIKEGVSNANKQTSNSFQIQPHAKVVNFDIAVEIAKENENKKGGGLSIKVVEGNLENSSKSKQSNISRINFTVGVNTIIT